MNSRKMLIMAHCMVWLIIAVIQAGPEWHSIGPESTPVSRVLIDRMSRVLAVTPDGLHILFQDNWYAIPLVEDLTVRGILEVDTGYIVASVGDGTFSDGVFLGVDILDGPPFYAFSRTHFLPNAQALAKRGMDGDTLFVGAGNSIYRSIADKDKQYGDLVQIKTPQLCFGVEIPYCTAIHFFTGDQRLYAGGYDQSSEPGPGHLLGQEGDSLVIVRELNVSSITQGCFYEVGPLELVVGTTDSGIYVYNPISSSSPWTQYESPNNEPVRQLITTPTMIWSDALNIAVASGVFAGQNGSWYETDDLPAEAYAVAADPRTMQIYAGTSNGVYVYGELGIRSKKFFVNDCSKTPLSISQQGVITVDYYAPCSGKITAALFDMSGKIVCQVYGDYVTAGANRLQLDLKGYHLGKGAFIITLSIDKHIVTTRMIVM